jgi:hypothetical protein
MPAASAGDDAPLNSAVPGRNGMDASHFEAEVRAELEKGVAYPFPMVAD